MSDALTVLLLILQVRALEGEIRGVKQECDKLLSQQRHLQSKLHALEEDLGRIHSKVTSCLFQYHMHVLEPLPHARV